MTAQLDLQQLAFDRGAAQPPKQPRKRALVSRYIVPGVVIVGFVAMLGWAARDRFVASKPVTVVPIVVTRAEVQPSGSPLFQAPGWIEPRPTPVLVAALTEGVVADLLVVEGQTVEAGQPVARLIDADAKLSLEQAQADLALRTAEVESIVAERQAANMRLQNPVHLQATLAEAQSQLAKIETELAGIPFLIEAAEARAKNALQNLESKQAAGWAVPLRAVQQAQSDHDSAAAELRELQSRGPRLEHEQQALQRRTDALARQLELLIDETRQVAATEAQTKIAQARARQAELIVQAAELRLDRMNVKAPIAGRVLSLVASPGSRVMGIDPGGEQKASTIVTLYDPQMLQVRADVRLEDVPLVQPGQPVEIETASAQGLIAGEVLYVTSQANVQKNTLEVKVAILTPPQTIRPEMLVTATFLAPQQPEAMSNATESSQRLLAPRQLIQAVGDSHMVWIADPSNVARRQTVRLGTAGTNDLVEIVEGLQPTDRLISTGRETLGDGDTITITGEDDSIGETAQRSRASAPRKPSDTLVTATKR